MKKLLMCVLLLSSRLFVHAQTMKAEDFYVSAFNEMSDMLAGRDSLSVKRSVYLAEWAFYEGKFDYESDFCVEIERIKRFILSLYEVNKLHTYKTGMQMAITTYMVSPYSGNGYTPYTYDFDNFSMYDQPWQLQFVSRTLKTHKGQCRSLPWMYKILANELNADVSLAYAPRHCYIMYKDTDKITPEEWINLELTTNQMNPSWWIKQEYEICDSAVVVGTYMTPLTDLQTVACQMADLAFGYKEKFNRYDEFTYYCASRSLEFYPKNPNAWLIRAKSLERMIYDSLNRHGNVVDDYTAYLIYLMDGTRKGYYDTHMTEETEEIRERRKQQVVEAQKYTQDRLQSK